MNFGHLGSGRIIHQVQSTRQGSKEPVLDGLQLENEAVVPPAEERNDGTDGGIGQEVVGGGDNGDEHGHGPEGSENAEEAVRGEAADGDGEEEGGAKVQAGHGGNGELEAVVVPGRGAAAAGLAVEDVDVAVLLGQQARRVAAPQGDDDKGDGVVEGNGAADAAKGRGRQHGVGVDDEADAEANVRVVNLGEDGHEPGVLAHNVLLEGELVVDAEELFEREHGEGVALGAGEDGFVAGDDSGRKGTKKLVDPVVLC